MARNREQSKQLQAILGKGVIAGVHTFELRAKGYDATVDVDSLPYIRNHGFNPRYGKGICKIEINPHKAERHTVEGVEKYKCLYGTNTGVEAVLKRAIDELGLKEPYLSRVDVCFNLGAPYEETDKLTRLLLLLLAQSEGLQNRYTSIDPLTNERKSISVRTRHKPNSPFQIQIEHYNRSQINQDEYDTVIINRLEMRLIGAVIGMIKSFSSAVESCKQMLDRAVTRHILGDVETRLTDGLIKFYHAEKAITGVSKIGVFARTNADQIYTRKQLVRLFTEESRNAEASERKFRSRYNDIELYTLQDLNTYADLLKREAEKYLEA